MKYSDLLPDDLLFFEPGSAALLLSNVNGRFRYYSFSFGELFNVPICDGGRIGVNLDVELPSDCHVLRGSHEVL